jgi:hypothetical protein
LEPVDPGWYGAVLRRFGGGAGRPRSPHRQSVSRAL